MFVLRRAGNRMWKFNRVVIVGSWIEIVPEILELQVKYGGYLTHNLFISWNSKQAPLHETFIICLEFWIPHAAKGP